MGKRLPIKVLLAGCDPEVQRRVAPALVKAVEARAGQVELAAVYDPLAEQAQAVRQALGVATATDNLTEALADGTIGAVVCAIDATRAADEVPTVLGRRVPTVLVPPLGRSLDDVLAMAEAAREGGATHMVAMPHRFSPYLARALRWARQLSPIRAVHARLTTDGDVDGPFLWNSALHAVDALSHILGRVEGLDLTPAHGAGAGAAVVLRCAEGSQGRLELVGHAEQAAESYEILGEGCQGTVVLQHLSGPSMQCWRGPRIEVRIQAPPNQPPVEYDGMYEALSAFFDAVVSEQRPAPTLEDVLPAYDLTQRLISELAPAVAAA